MTKKVKSDLNDDGTVDSVEKSIARHRGVKSPAAEASVKNKATSETTVNATSPSEMTINDLMILRTCIEVCSERGAFKADELKVVGSVYEKLNAFLIHLMPPKTDTAVPSNAQTKGE